MVQLFQGLDVMSAAQVRDMVDKLAERVFDLEQGQAATTHFHVVKPEDVDVSYAHVSVDIGPHTNQETLFLLISHQKNLMISELV